MRLFYEGTDITKDVRVISATNRDCSGGRTDSLELVVGEAAAWYCWEPQPDDKIELTRGGYSTGVLYLNAVQPEDGNYRILATAQPVRARRRANKSYENKTLKAIMGLCAGECGMDWRLYGIDGGIRYPYLVRTGESCAAFLNRLAEAEGAVLKSYSGRFVMIDILAAQRAVAAETIRLSAEMPGTVYTRKGINRINELEVLSPHAWGRATDTAAENGLPRTEALLAARDAATAGRWARGLLLSANRQLERLTVMQDFHSSWTAMVKVEITGDTAANGAWLIDEVHHDFVNGTSRAELLRCVETVK